ncbi:MAG: SRPBCC family protein [Chloroflexota bacterium]
MGEIKAKGSVTIDRPISEVFAYVEDPHNQHNWQPNLQEVRVSGQSITEVRKQLGRRVEHQIEVVDRQENKKLSHRGAASSHEGAMERHMTFEEADSGKTKVSLEVDVDMRGKLGPAAQMAQRAIQRDITGNLEHLKDLLEADESHRRAMDASGLKEHSQR